MCHSLDLTALALGRLSPNLQYNLNDDKHLNKKPERHLTAPDVS